jgi:glycosyltransferase involved in cell wall biosynthesis
MKKTIQEARGVFADGFDLSRSVEERFGRKCFFLATARTIAPDPALLKLGKRGSTGKPYDFLFVGRIEKVKGIDLLLQSMALLIEEEPDVHLMIVGKGSLEGWASRFINQRGLEKWITLRGNVDDKTLALLYASSDCVVIPSRSESIPLVFSEALNFDKDLIVTDVGDMGALGRQYGAAWVVPPEDSVALKEMMRKRVESVGDVTDEGHARKTELKQLFNIETSVERFLADYS